MAGRSIPLSLVLVFCMAGCAATSQQASSGFKRPSGDYRLVIMRPDISVGVLTAGGLIEPREDWSLTARDNILVSLKKQQAKSGGTTQVVYASASASEDDATTNQLDRLHEAVGQAILFHKYTPGGALPTKKDKFDWTLGKLATDYGAATGNDYALFLYARDSFSSGGRVALQAMSMLGCIVGVCMMPGGGTQQAFASLVDLKTGNVVWFNHLISTVGDIRTPEGADKMVEQLLESMRDAKTKNKKTG